MHIANLCKYINIGMYLHICIHVYVCICVCMCVCLSRIARPLFRLPLWWQKKGSSDIIVSIEWCQHATIFVVC